MSLLNHGRMTGDTAGPERYDALVIGAGMAGLAAAEQLSSAGARVMVIEARNRIGGRIHSVNPAGWTAPVELGAEFLHGRHSSLESLAKEAAVDIEPVPEIHWRSEGGQLRRVVDFWRRVGNAFQRIGPAFSGSFIDWIRANASELSSLERRDLREVVTGFHAADPEKASARTLFVAAHQEEEQQRLRGGYSRIAAQLHERLVERGVEFELNAPVHHISWRSGEVEISSGAAARRWRGRLAVITLPLGVLQAGADAPGGVTFEPPLADRAARWKRLGLGHVVRVVFRLNDDIWDAPILPAELRENGGRSFGFVHSDQPTFPMWWSDAPEPVIVGWWGGPEARVAQGLTEAEVFVRARQSLSATVGVSIEQLDDVIVDQQVHNWSRDLYSRGAYSFATAGEESAPEELATPVKSTLFFAGEAFSSALLAGTVQGAFESGVRAGQGAVAVLKGRRRRPVTRGMARSGPRLPQRIPSGS